MAPESNWLSFSLSSMEMFNNSTQPQMLHDSSPADDSQNYYFADNFYANGWADTNHQVSKSVAENGMSNLYNSYMEPRLHDHAPPKLEDFLGGDTVAATAYSQTETNDSSLTHIYDHHHHGGSNSAAVAAYFNDHNQELNNITGFQAFSTNSGSDVDDSASVGKNNQVLGGGEFVGRSIESSTELAVAVAAAAGYTQCPPNGNGLSLAVVSTNNNNNNNVKCNEKAIVPVDSDTCKKISDTFGQRTSIYRGVTRHRWTGRYEAHLWDNSCRREGQARKGRQGMNAFKL
ncbi:hypothetical protein Leryth_012773 [Lithospermum erythrorhizon]|nr:hypothetical protein Leryth_012773 [Lithospermum erythrorhizon]